MYPDLCNGYSLKKQCKCANFTNSGQGFSTLVLLTFWVQHFLCRLFSIIPGLYLIDATSVPYLFHSPSCDN